MDKVISNRNLTNKLWNAGKFILFNLKDATEQEWDQLGRGDFTSQRALECLPLAERWIVSLLHEVGSGGSQGLLYVWAQPAGGHVGIAWSGYWRAGPSRVVLAGFLCALWPLRVRQPGYQGRFWGQN